ncbi:Uncharacterised protein [Bordetella pertussis]|nr:Uncharacterised protein [Bordetella pertussis]CFO07268.1 Uncharacterised protein [Bordetella pertussis]CFO64879.1 Uncharacterised protein [Bordetella pertussis]CFU01810.1 Uncharacterised protein [Bordetella pertussis]CFU79166.1 Uncharacterised protein [Bordetella pertussis]
MTGSVAIQPYGASANPTRPLMAMKVTLLVRNRPCRTDNSQRLRFILSGVPCDCAQAEYADSDICILPVVIIYPAPSGQHGPGGPVGNRQVRTPHFH